MWLGPAKGLLAIKELIIKITSFLNLIGPKTSVLAKKNILKLVHDFSNTPHRWTDTQGCGVGLADVKLSPFIDITLFDTQI